MWASIIAGVVGLALIGLVTWYAYRQGKRDEQHIRDTANADAIKDKRRTEAEMAGKSHADLDDELRRQRDELRKADR